MFNIKIYNNISKKGLDNLDNSLYKIIDCKDDGSKSNPNSNGILLRSYNLSNSDVEDSVLAVARAGAGVNNIDIESLTNRGIVVFNTPGANANAVKELVLAGMFLAARNIIPAWSYVNNIINNDNNSEELQQIESAKKQFKGFELPGKTIAVIGLGAIGVKVANSTLNLGMKVIGYDPCITVERAWELSSDVKQAKDINYAIKHADFITVHVPYNSDTESLIDKNILDNIKSTAILLNFSRGKIVAEELIEQYLDNNKLACYVTDFPNKDLLKHKKVITLPHIGASTKEAEENCAIVAVNNLKNFLEKGIINNSVNFPQVIFTENFNYRIAVINKNIPNMVAQITGILAEHNLNILDLINKSKDNIAYSLIDLDNKPIKDVLDNIKRIEGVISVREI